MQPGSPGAPELMGNHAWGGETRKDKFKGLQQAPCPYGFLLAERSDPDDRLAKPSEKRWPQKGGSLLVPCLPCQSTPNASRLDFLRDHISERSCAEGREGPKASGHLTDSAEFQGPFPLPFVSHSRLHLAVPHHRKSCPVCQLLEGREGACLESPRSKGYWFQLGMYLAGRAFN